MSSDADGADLADLLAEMRAQRERVDKILGLGSPARPRPSPQPSPQRPPADASDEERAEFWARRYVATNHKENADEA